MSQEEKDPKLAPVRSMFLDGSVERMKDIEKLYPTYIARLLGLNHSRYVRKLYKPEELTIKQIRSFAKRVDIDPQIVTNIILNQLAADDKQKNNLSK